MAQHSAAAWTSGVAVAALAFGPLATAEVFKCEQPTGRVLYSDVPCKGGAIVDVNGGAASPAAVRRLAHDNAAFDRKMAARRNAEDIAAFRREQLDTQRAATESARRLADAAATAPQYIDAGYGYLATVPVKPYLHDRHRVAHPHVSKLPARPSPLMANPSRNR